MLILRHLNPLWLGMAYASNASLMKATKLTLLYQAELEQAVNKIVDASPYKCRCEYVRGRVNIIAQNGQRWTVKAAVK